MSYDMLLVNLIETPLGHTWKYAEVIRIENIVLSSFII